MNKEAIELLEEISTANMRLLADWLDIKYKDDPTPKVQEDLRQWADRIDQVLTILKQQPTAGEYETRTIENTEVCPCGNIFVEADDYDTLGSESGVCCPSCGNEKFQTVKSLLDTLEARIKDLLEALKKYGQHSQECHDERYPEKWHCICGYEVAISKAKKVGG